jgi:hypothetical protein
MLLIAVPAGMLLEAEELERRTEWCRHGWKDERRLCRHGRTLHCHRDKGWIRYRPSVVLLEDLEIGGVFLLKKRAIITTKKIIPTKNIPKISAGTKISSNLERH